MSDLKNKLLKPTVAAVQNRVIRTEYKTIIKKEQARAEALYSAGMQNIAEQIMLSLRGGECIECKVPWVQVAVDNMFAKFEYYRPACKCYPLCSTGHTIWIDNGVPGHHNSGCGVRLTEEWYAGMTAETRMMSGTKQYRNVLKCNKCGNLVELQSWTATTVQK